MNKQGRRQSLGRVTQAGLESFPVSDAPRGASGADAPSARALRVPIEGGELHCEVSGVGPNVVFLHAFPLSGRMWDRVTAELDVCAIVPDLRGHGQSSSVEETSIEVLADDVVGLLDTLGITQPVVFCGLSLGSIVALDLYRRHRRRVRALVLGGCRPQADSPERATQREALARQVEAAGSVVAAETLTGRLLADSASASLRAEVRRIIADNDSAGISATSRALARRQDYSSTASTIEHPTLLVYGLLDAITPPELGVSLYSEIDPSRLELIADAAHLAPMEQPRNFALVVGDFIARLPRLEVGGTRDDRSAPSSDDRSLTLDPPQT